MTAPAQPGSSESGHPTGHPAGARAPLARLLLARHGQTDHNVERRMQGQIDIPLNGTGRGQARALARALREDPPDVIVCSPLSRARETAEIIGEELRLEVAQDDALLERGFGSWEGLTGEEIRERWPEEYGAWQQRHVVPGIGMETRGEVARRVGECCRRLVADHADQRILVVAHGAAITLGICDLLGLDPDGFRGIAGLENCHRSTLEPLLSDRDGRLMRLLSHNLSPDFS